MKRVRVSEKTIKNFLKVAVAIAVVVAFIMPGAALIDNEDKCRFPDTIVSIFPLSWIVKKGETFTVSVDVGPGEPIRGVSFDYLYFDPTLVHVNNVTEGNLFDPYNTIFNGGTINNTNGTITNMYCYTTDPANNVTGSGFLCNISFTAQENLGTSPLDLEGVIIENATGGEASVTINDGKVAVVWSATLNFNETSGINDYVVFGEAADANDGPPVDIYYDKGKPPAPMPPYIRGWFDDGLDEPHDYLLKDYRRYPDTEKTWDLYAEWVNSSSDPVNIMISWNTSEFDDCEYNTVVLMRIRYDPSGDEWEFAADMLTEEEYVYSPRWFGGQYGQWLIDHFQIITAFDTKSPEITNVAMNTSDPLDTVIGWEKISCAVIDNVVVDEVKLVLVGDTTTEYPMIKDGDDYYCNITISTPDEYTYHIWADDLIGNENTSAPQSFDIPMNEDVDMGGKVHFMDLIAVARRYGDQGPDGWCREDVDNGGKVHFMDLIAIARLYGEEW